jgi:hypothetical protein
LSRNSIPGEAGDIFVAAPARDLGGAMTAYGVSMLEVRMLLRLLNDFFCVDYTEGM